MCVCALEFSTNVEVKYEAYMKERIEYLERNKVCGVLCTVKNGIQTFSMSCCVCPLDTLTKKYELFVLCTEYFIVCSRLYWLSVKTHTMVSCTFASV